MPAIWKRANVTAIFKSAGCHCVENYRPISLVCTVSKVLEKCIYNHCYTFICGRIHKLQHGFLEDLNCITQLLPVYHKILSTLNSKNFVNTIYVDFKKAFDKVPHHLLLYKLRSFGLCDFLHNWFNSYITGRIRRVVLDGYYFEWLGFGFGVARQSVLGPFLFTLYINDLTAQVNPPTEIALCRQL